MSISAAHLISSIHKINFGVWNVVISTFCQLEKYGCSSSLFFPHTDEEIPDKIKKVKHVPLEGEISRAFLKSTNGKTIVVSHGNWSYATKWAFRLKQKGYKWIAVPHGMLEPWSMEHKKWKKKLYFLFFEKRMLNRADAIVAVGKPEYENLRGIFGDKVVRIPNGISPYKGAIKKQEKKRIFLFMGRLHHKKGVLPLVQAWLKSSLVNDPAAELWIAGPDEGERQKVAGLLEKGGGALGSGHWALGTGHCPPAGEARTLGNEQADDDDGSWGSPAWRRGRGIGKKDLDNGRRISSVFNIKMLGAVYGEEKEEVLKEAHFFVLPSQSEGFPTSIIESMTYGCVPIITEGCNFPEAVENGVAIKTFFDVDRIMQSLEYGFAMDDEEFKERSYAAKHFADSHYNLEKVAEQQYDLYERVLKGKG